ncbi:MAG: hypothetical protein GC172_10155 [Phycisphaera sp.]|nr:hypothetical protein [Phycisphaera sp.]
MKPPSLRSALLAICCVAATEVAPAARAALLEPPVEPPVATPTATPVEPMREDPALAADLAILARFDVPFPETKSFREATAREVIDAAAKAAGHAVEIDGQIVGDSGGWELIQLSCDARTPRQALDAVARAISTSYRRMELEVVAGIPVFSEYSRATRLVALKRYDLQAILSRMAADRSEDTTDDERAVTITDLLTEGVDPEGWVDLGGNISRFRVIGRTLIVWTTPSRHHAIKRLLEELERALPSPTQVWRIRVAEIAAEANPEAIEAALGSAAGLDALLAANGASLVAAPKLVALRGKEASIAVGSDDEAVDVRISPTEARDASLVEVRRRTNAGNLAVTLRAVERVRGAGIVSAGNRSLLVEVLCEEEKAESAGQPAARP